MKAIIRNRLRRSKRRIERRLEGDREDSGRPVLSARRIRVELADKTRAIRHSGIGLIHQLAHATGLIEAIDRRVHVLRVRRPYHESDHVLNLAYNAICGGVRYEDIELRRNSISSSRMPSHIAL